MPNIEIHGFGYQSLAYGTHVDNSALELKSKIFGLFKEQPYAEDIVVTVCADEVIDIIAKRQPFIRVVSTQFSRLNEIVEVLRKNMGMDIELMILFDFYPKPKKRQ